MGECDLSLSRVLLPAHSRERPSWVATDLRRGRVRGLLQQGFCSVVRTPHRRGPEGRPPRYDQMAAHPGIGAPPSA
jgi:hypothetical protein